MLARLTSGIALTSMAALVLVGCTPEEPTETTSPPTTPASTGASEGELIDEARNAWDEYQAVISASEADPSSATRDALVQVATEDLVSAHMEDLERAAALHVHTEGDRLTTAFEPLEVAVERDSITASICVDISQVRVLAEDGSDRTPPDRETLLSFSASFERSDADSALLVASANEFSGPSDEDPCI